ncbi:MAG: IS30 family transposase [Oscillospiraceae bacterium]|nr:IS30 family transposase [Oscillospiraceae bacterium]
MRYFKHLTYTDRLIIESMIKSKRKPADIAKRIGVHRSTVYRELKKGIYNTVDYELREITAYSPEIAYTKYKSNLKEKGQQIKLGNDYKLAEHIENKIINDKYSPEAVLGEIKVKGIIFDTTICVSTLYSYINKGVFLNITNADLMYKGKRKRKYRKVRPNRVPRGTSIEKRPVEINNRAEFGHWEMDLIIGKKNTKSAVLVMTERLTRTEIKRKIPDKTANSVIKEIDKLEANYQSDFNKIFKSITVDNGSEFNNSNGLEQSIRTSGNRTKIYYCHPYSSWERGSNENQNKMIRRHFPKGTNFDNVTDEEINKVEVWLNNYPRKIFGYKTSYDLLLEHLEKII